ncbi:MAG: TlpA disulfide reductase family protein [Bacteroidota bacterium]
MKDKIARHILILLFVCSLGYAKSSTVRIAGLATEHKGSTIYALTFHDIYTQSLQKIAQATIDSTGKFVLDIPCNEIEYLQLRLNYLNAKMWIQPEQEYQITILPLPEGKSISINNRTTVPYTFDRLDENDINYKILSYNSAFDLFFSENYALIQSMTAPPSSHFQKVLKGDSIELKDSSLGKSKRALFIEKVMEFHQKLNEEDPIDGNSYFSIYRKMSIADFLVNSGQKDRVIFENFIANTPLVFENLAYQDFLKNFFKNYFADFTDKWGDNGLSKAVQEADLESICQLLKKDDFILNDEMRDFVIIHALYEVQNNRALNKQSIRDLFSEISAKGSTEYIKNLAISAQQKMNKTAKGFPAYKFNLYNEKEELKSLENFSGKFIVLNFWTDWCSSCKKEMALLAELNKKYKKHFQFVSINLDEDEEIMLDYLNSEKNKDWHFLHGKDPLLSESYNVLSLPTFILLDQNGNFLNAYCKKPSEGLEETIYTLFQKEELKAKSNRRTGKK